MRPFEIDLNKLPEEQSQPSSPVARDFTRPEGAHPSPSPERRTSLDLIRQPGESSISREGQRPIHDFTRHFAQNPYYHQREPQPSQETQRTVENTAFRPWQAPQSQEAQHHPEQPLPKDAPRSPQQPQEGLYPHARLDDIQRALQFSINELERLRSSVPRTEHIAQQPEERLLSHDEVATVSASDSQGAPSQSSNRKRKHDEASSSRVQVALDGTLSWDDLALPQPAQPDQSGHEQQSEDIIDRYQNKRKRDHKKEYQARATKAKEQGTTLHRIRKARAVEQGTTPYGMQKARAAEQGTTLYRIRKAKAAEQGTTPMKIRYARYKARLAEQGITSYEMQKAKDKAKAEELNMTVEEWKTARKKLRLEGQSNNPKL